MYHTMQATDVDIIDTNKCTGSFHKVVVATVMSEGGGGGSDKGREKGWQARDG